MWGSQKTVLEMGGTTSFLLSRVELIKTNFEGLKNGFWEKMIDCVNKKKENTAKKLRWLPHCIRKWRLMTLYPHLGTMS